MTLKGVKVKQMASYPLLLDVDYFYYEMHQVCKNDFKSILEYCKLYKMTDEEILDSVSILNQISNTVKENASS